MPGNCVQEMVGAITREALKAIPPAEFNLSDNRRFYWNQMSK
jgi:hypothetical protein